MPVFTANVPGVLQIGDRIEIGGKIKENARKMSVNLCAQEGEEPRDVVLHFDVRFHRDNIISLSRKNGIWIGSGNYDTNYNMFVPGTIFRIIFEIKDTDVITIYCQGKFHSNFLPKIPLTMAKYIVAWADVERITHCYFQIGVKGENGSQGVEAPECSPALFSPPSPRAMVAGDGKRCPRIVRRKANDSPRLHSSQESSEDDETVKPRPKAEGRADKFFYETLMCQPKEHGKYAGSPESAKFRSPSQARSRAEYARKYRDDNDSEYSEDLPSKNVDSSLADSEDVLLDKKSRRRGKFPFAQQMVNFMGKNGKRN